MDRSGFKVKRFKRKLRFHPHTLSLISMIDIFTTLLMFLIIFSGEELITPPPPDLLMLPQSTAQDIPVPTVTILITKDSVIIGNQRIVSLDDLKKSDSMVLGGLKNVLDEEREKNIFISSKNEDVKFQGKVTVLADRATPFNVIEKVMHTATRAKFSQISFALMRKE